MRRALLFLLPFLLLIFVLAGSRVVRDPSLLPDALRAALRTDSAAPGTGPPMVASGAFGAGPSRLSSGSRLLARATPEPLAADPGGVDPRVFSLNQDGVALFKGGDTEGALEKLEDAYLRMPDNPAIARNYSNVLTFVAWQSLKAEDYDDALRKFDRALDADSGNVGAWKGSGFSRVQLKETEAAIRDFEEALRLSPGDTDAALALARLLYQGDRLARAKRVLDDLLRADPANERARKLMARVAREDKVERRFQASDTGHFRLKFDISENADLGAAVSAILEEAYAIIGSRFRHFPSDPVVVILYTREQFRSVSGSPHWSRGVFDGKIRIPVGGVNERTEELEDVVFHEYTHVVVNQITRGRCPTWLNEGLAQFSEPSTEGAKRALLQPLRGSRLVPLSRLEGSFLKLPGDAARIAYAQALAAVLYISDTYSFYHLRSILDRIGKGEAPEVAVKRVLHYGYSDLQTGIKDYLRRSG